MLQCVSHTLCCILNPFGVEAYAGITNDVYVRVNANSDLVDQVALKTETRFPVYLFFSYLMPRQALEKALRRRKRSHSTRVVSHLPCNMR
jgi:hypothetical protein